jgi:uncharacterized membrane protein
MLAARLSAVTSTRHDFARRPAPGDRPSTAPTRPVHLGRPVLTVPGDEDAGSLGRMVGLPLLPPVPTHSGVLAQAAVLNQAWRVAATHGDWMAWNLVLALVPLALAAVLFRRNVRRSPLWWLGVVAFIAFLPNAPYVLTDVIHLFDDIRGTRSDLELLGLHLPIYLLFFAAGFGSYVAALELTRRYTRAELPAVRWLYLELALHGLCAAGIYLGRVLRLNSWEILTRPRSVIGGISWMAGAAPAVLVACTALVLVGLTLTTRALVWAAADGVARARPHLRPLR